MSFLGFDTSRDSGAPVEFYEFILGEEAWRYTTANVPLECQGHTYEPAIISRDDKELTGELTGKRMMVKVSGLSPLAMLYQVYVPANPLVLRILRIQRDDPDQEVETIWTGMCRAVSWDDTHASLACEHISMVTGRTGLHFYYQAMCGRIWGSWQCGVAVADYTTKAVVTAVSDTAIACVHGQAADYFKGGFVEYKNNDFRMIASSTDSAIIIPYPFADLAIGDELTLFAGCDRTHANCTDRFDNSINYGGCMYVPQINPFSNGVV